MGKLCAGDYLDYGKDGYDDKGDEDDNNGDDDDVPSCGETVSK